MTQPLWFQGAVIYLSVQHPLFVLPILYTVSSQIPLKNIGKTHYGLLPFEHVRKGKGEAALEQLDDVS